MPVLKCRPPVLQENKSFQGSSYIYRGASKRNRLVRRRLKDERLLQTQRLVRRQKRPCNYIFLRVFLHKGINLYIFLQIPKNHRLQRSPLCSDWLKQLHQFQLLH